MPATTFFLPSESSCCLCGSADSLAYGTAATGCGDGVSPKYILFNAECDSLRSTSNCPTWHDLTVTSAMLSVAYTETITGDCCCLYLPGTGGCGENGCPESGSGSIVTDLSTSNVVSYGISLNGSYIVIGLSGTETRTENTDCVDGSSGETSLSKTISIVIPKPVLTCATTPGLCSNSRFSIYTLPASEVIVGDEGHTSFIGECLTEQGVQCDPYSGLCDSFGDCDGSSGDTYTPDISASISLVIQNWQGETIATKEIYPEFLACPLANYISCCNCRCLSGSYSYQYTLSGTVIVRVGNE